MPTPELRDQTAAWLTNLNNQHGFDGVVHEVAAVRAENQAYSLRIQRYRQQLGTTADMLMKLYDQTGLVELLDAARDLHRLIEWADSGYAPIQLDLFPMPEAEA